MTVFSRKSKDVSAELTSLSACEMARLIAERRISATELVEAHLRRIEQEQARLNAFVHVDATGARKAAERADERVKKTGSALGSLHGVPITIKSSIDVA